MGVERPLSSMWKSARWDISTFWKTAVWQKVGAMMIKVGSKSEKAEIYDHFKIHLNAYEIWHISIWRSTALAAYRKGVESVVGVERWNALLRIGEMCQDASFKQFFLCARFQQFTSSLTFFIALQRFLWLLFFLERNKMSSSFDLNVNEPFGVAICDDFYDQMPFTLHRQNTRIFFTAHQCNFQTFMLPMERAATHINPIKWDKHNLQSWMGVRRMCAHSSKLLPSSCWIRRRNEQMWNCDSSNKY